MQPIIATIKPDETGPQVANLQDALRLLLERGLIRSLDPPNSPTAEELAKLAQLLADERAQSLYGDATRRLVQIVQIQEGLGDNLGDLGVEAKTADVLNRLLRKLGKLDETGADEFVVKGRVTLVSGMPAPGLIVRARDRDLRTFQPLGKETVTDPDGRYEICYSRGEFSRAEKGNADLVIRVFSPDSTSDSDSPVVESPTLFNAPPVAEIDRQVPDTGIKRSEFERHVEAIAPLLAGQAEGGGDLPIAALTESDIDFLADDTGIDRQHIAWLVQAAVSEEQSKRVDLTIHTHVAQDLIPSAVFYGWFREGLPDQWEQLIEQSIGTLRTAARAAIAHEVIPAELEASLESSLDAMPNPRRDALRAAVTMAGLGQEALGAVLQHAGAVAEVNNPLVSRLVDEGKMKSAEAHRMGLGLAAHGLVDGHEATMAAIVSAKPARLGGRRLQRARDLAALDMPDIEKALGDANVEPPAGIMLASYATRLAGQIAEVFPTDALLHRATNVSDEVVSAVEQVVAGHVYPGPISTSDRWEKFFGRSWPGEQLAPAGTAPTDDGSRAQSDPQLRAFINLHPGLGLGKVVDETTDAAVAVSTIKERVAWVDRVRDLNPDLDLFAIDYLPESESLKQVKFDGLSDDARSMVVANLKAYQRIQSVGAGALGGIELLKAGYRSATAMARSLPSEIAEKTGLPVAEVRAYHAQAERKATDAALTWFAFHDLERDARTINHRGLLDPPAYLKKLTGYDQLFGSPNFCHCEHCQSVLGAAAYFVDLMYFVERHILGHSFKDHGGEQHSLHLRRRRPDLWSELELTCDNTNKVVPSLDLVIDLLEQVPGDESYRISRAIGIENVAARFLFDPEPRAALIAEVARDVYRIVKRGGDAGFEPAALMEIGLSDAETVALVDANLSSAANDGKPFERVPCSTTHYRLRAAVSEAAAIAGFGTNPQDFAATKSILRHRSVDLVLRHHAETVLAAKASTAVKVSPEKTRALLDLAMPSAPAQRQSLIDALQGGPLPILATVLDRLIRYAVLFRSAVYDPQALEFVRANLTVLALSDPATAETVRRVSRYASLAAAPDPAFAPDAPKTDTSALQSVLTWTDSIANVTTDPQWTQLALALRTNVPHVKGVLSQMALPGGGAVAPRVDELSQLKSALTLTRRLGVAPEILRLAVSEDLAELARGAEGVFAAIRAKYPDEKTFRDKLEPFDDKLRSRTRDGLVEYLLSAPDDQTTDWRKRFASANDLYYHFLTDVMVEGCARTSKVVAAVSSVQLYVHRVLMNLEQSEGSPVVAARFDDAERQEEWKWRKNYQVWVANRKVFLYPENYIEPGLRDDKTPLFKDLEDTLLQQQITEQNVLDAYAQYLHGFEEVARLRIAGAYHDRHYDEKQQPTSDLLHLFGVTASDPPVYYYRTIRNLENKKGPVFSAWEKSDLQIPVRKVSPIVFLGRLYVFWVETTTRPLNSEFKKGDSEFIGYRHSVRTKFSQLRLDGRWTPPQTIRVLDNSGAAAEVRLVDDPFSLIVIPAVNANISEPQAGNAPKGYKRVRWDIRERDHTKAIETYAPEGFQWGRVYPNVGGSAGQSHITLKFPARSDRAPALQRPSIYGTPQRVSTHRQVGSKPFKA